MEKILLEILDQLKDINSVRTPEVITNSVPGVIVAVVAIVGN